MEYVNWGLSLYGQHKDYILGALAILTALLTYRERVGNAVFKTWEGIKWVCTRLPVELSPESRDIVYNIMKAQVYDEKNIIHFGHHRYFPDGTIKRMYAVDNVKGDGFDIKYAEVPLTSQERKALKQVHKTKLAELKAQFAANLRASAQHPEKSCLLMRFDGTSTNKTSRKASVIIVDEPQGPNSGKIVT